VPDIGWYGLILAVAAGSTAALTVPAKRIAVRAGYIALPGDRSVHKKPIPYGGGASMFLGFLVAVVLATTLPPFRAANTFTDSPEMLGVVLAGGAMFAVGLIDDVRDMSAPAKMAGQVLAASILYFFGVTMWQLKIPLAGFYVLTPGIIPLITAIWVIALTNAVNLIDGLDGLAAGVVAIGGGALAVYGIRLMGLGLLPADNIGPLVAVIACGICLGFLPFNFNPARIFMGDAGAHFLGLLMAASTMLGISWSGGSSSSCPFPRRKPGWKKVYSATPRAAAPIGMMAFTRVTKSGKSRKLDRTAVHAHRMMTLRRGPWPRFNSRWWMCSLSGVPKPLPLAVRRTNAKAMSTSGTPRMNSGMNSGAKKK